MSTFKYASKHDGLTWIESPAEPGEVICVDGLHQVVAAPESERKAARKALEAERAPKDKDGAKDGAKAEPPRAVPPPDATTETLVVEPTPEHITGNKRNTETK